MGGHCIWAKWGRFVISPVLCLLAYGDTALNFSSPMLAFGVHKQGCDNDTFRAVFPASGYPGTPKHCKTRENANRQIDPSFPPSLGGTQEVCTLAVTGIDEV